MNESRSAEAMVAAARTVVRAYRSKALTPEDAMERIIAALDAPLEGQEIPIFPPARQDGS